MKGDFTRFGFDPSKHFSRVLQQQGRVTLDADGNESTAILLHHLRALTRDLYGPFGGPADAGFALAVDATGNVPALMVSPGHYYVEGMLCENEAWVDYAQQPEYQPAAPDASGAGGDALLAWLRNPDDTPGFWIYLDVWERLVSWIEDDSIREVALGGPDTCARAKLTWQVRALPWNADWGDIGADEACVNPLPALGPAAPARLAARVDPGPQFTDPCVVTPGAMYRGAQNHLYRVEVHRGGVVGEATFKWSRDNGSVATRWLGVEGEALVAMTGRGFSAGDWVEISHDALVLDGQPGQLLRVASVEGDRLVLDPASIPATGLMSWTSELVSPWVRRWDHKAGEDIVLRDGAVPVQESSATGAEWIDLEDGVQIAFAGGGDYRSGDYWVIPARVASGDIQWPQDAGQPALRLPQGIVHHIAPLGVLVNNDGLRITPCRRCMATAGVECRLPLPPPRAGEFTDGRGRRVPAPPARAAVAAKAAGKTATRRRKK